MKSAEELLLRILAMQLPGMSCVRCGSSLREASTTVRRSDVDQIVIDARCPACEHVHPLRVTPQADGFAHVQ